MQHKRVTTKDDFHEKAQLSLTWGSIFGSPDPSHSAIKETEVDLRFEIYERFPKLIAYIIYLDKYNKDVNLPETAFMIFHVMVIIYEDLNVKI